MTIPPHHRQTPGDPGSEDEASEAQDAAAAPDELEIIAFELASETYAIESRYAREVHPLTNLTPIPCTPGFVLGVINIRGRLCPVVDLKRLLGLPARGLNNAARALVIHDAAMEFAIAADVVVGVRSVDRAAVQPPSATAPEADSHFVYGVTTDQMLIFDAGRILAHPAVVVNERVDD